MLGVGMAVVISFHSERRRRGEAAKQSPKPRSVLRSSDPVMVAIRLCHEMEALNNGQDRWVLVKTLCTQTNLPRQLVVGAAVYAHVRGWLICTPFSLLLREEGRALLSCSPIDEYRPSPLEADFLLDAISQAGD